MTVYTPGAPTVSGTKLTVDQLVNNPVLVQKSVAGLVNKKLIGGLMLAGRLDVTGSGSAVFEGDDNIFAEDAAEVVDDLAEYPLTKGNDPEMSVYTVDKYGLAIDIPDKYIARNRIDLVQRRLAQIANRIVAGFDTRVLSAIGSAVVETQSATAIWGTANANPLRDVLLADAKIEAVEKGFEGDVVALRPILWAELAASRIVLEFASQPGNTNPLANGKFFTFAGKTFLKSNYLPSGVDVMVADSRALGTIMWENQGGGYQGDPSDVNGVESKVIRLEKQDGVRIQVRKAQEPVVVEPGAGVKVTGVKSS